MRRRLLFGGVAEEAQVLFCVVRRASAQEPDLLQSCLFAVATRLPVTALVVRELHEAILAHSAGPVLAPNLTDSTLQAPDYDDPLACNFCSAAVYPAHSLSVTPSGVGRQMVPAPDLRICQMQT